MAATFTFDITSFHTIAYFQKVAPFFTARLFWTRSYHFIFVFAGFRLSFFLQINRELDFKKIVCVYLYYFSYQTSLVTKFHKSLGILKCISHIRGGFCLG